MRKSTAEFEMRTISMGLNREPDWVKADEVIARWTEKGDLGMVQMWERLRDESLNLRDEIVTEVEKNGCVRLSWSCDGETRHTMHSCQWKKAMPEYDFEIGRYKCIVRKKK